ncbi:hypothetical protein GCM10009832_04150 [Dietzia kunjamensis subsp. schimae]
MTMRLRSVTLPILPGLKTSGAGVPGARLMSRTITCSTHPVPCLASAFATNRRRHATPGGATARHLRTIGRPYPLEAPVPISTDDTPQAIITILDPVIPTGERPRHRRPRS